MNTVIRICVYGISADGWNLTSLTSCDDHVLHITHTEINNIKCTIYLMMMMIIVHQKGTCLNCFTYFTKTLKWCLVILCGNQFLRYITKLGRKSGYYYLSMANIIANTLLVFLQWEVDLAFIAVLRSCILFN